MLLPTLAVLGPIAALWYGTRRVRAYRAERLVRARFERGADGVIRGAEPIALNGEGLGNMWGRQKAHELFKAAGFTSVEEKMVEGDIINVYYICRKD